MKRVKLIALIMAIVTLLSVLPAFANAASVDIEAELEKRLNAAAASLNDKCDVSDLNLAPTQQNGMMIYHLITDNAENFHIKGLSTLATSDKILEVQIEYTIDLPRYKQMLGEMRKVADDVIAGLDDGGYDDVEKALVIHDAIADMCTYSMADVSFVGSAWTAYGTLVGKKSVCEGYSKSYKYLLEKVGIKSIIISSNQLNHAWNIVYINNVPYHVDVTYDDPVSNVPVVKHTYFLCSTQKMKSYSEHNANDFDTSPTATTYDNMDFGDIITPVMHANGKIYYSADQKLKSYDGGKVTDLLALKNLEVLLSGTTYRVIPPTTAQHGGNIFYHDEKNIYVYNTDTGNVNTAYTSPYNYIVEIDISGNTLSCKEGNSFNSTTVKALNVNSISKPDTSKIFKDIKAKGWYKKAVDYCYEHGFIKGVSDNEFGRETKVTRGMFITVLARMAGVSTTGKANKITTKFTDVKSGKYYVAAIKWASDNKVVSGTSATTFGPEEYISRQDLCVMVVNFAKFMNIDVTAQKSPINFTDGGKIAKYAKNAVSKCQTAGIVNGYEDGTFGPRLTATRAEAAQILYVFHSNFAH